jgi:hypothetical protein
LSPKAQLTAAPEKSKGTRLETVGCLGEGRKGRHKEDILHCRSGIAEKKNVAGQSAWYVGFPFLVFAA